jgi:3-deoxy-D-arabino-heptulosonate 7-phosphate (DAHP) synthase
MKRGRKTLRRTKKHSKSQRKTRSHKHHSRKLRSRRLRGGNGEVVVAGPAGVMNMSEFQKTMENVDNQGPE